jgi:prepilin-type N-terminal cleavage/methylation domain-containing protein
MNTRNHPQGFTLLELMLVIGIIALIAAVAIPNFKPVLHDAELEQSAQFLQADLMKARQMAKNGEETDKKRARVVFIPPDQYRIELETGDSSGNYETVATKRLAANCSFDSLPAEDYIVFNNDGSANDGSADIVDDPLEISINNDSATISVYRATGRVEVSYR